MRKINKGVMSFTCYIVNTPICTLFFYTINSIWQRNASGRYVIFIPLLAMRKWVDSIKMDLEETKRRYGLYSTG
jgi:hypothetical protein